MSKSSHPGMRPDGVRAAGVLLYCNVNADAAEGNEDSTQKFFLLMRHANRWDLPKGHCDGDESFQETALREMEEETGIKIDQVELDPTFKFDLRYPVTYRKHGNQVFDKHVRYFLGKLACQPDFKVPEIKVTEHESFEWFAWAPPHVIQAETIDPLLAAVADYFRRK